MNKTEAKRIADSYVEKMQEDFPVAIEINHEITEEFSLGFVFFYSSKEYWKTRSRASALVGNGPLLVRRSTGELVVLPSYQSVERSIAELEN